VVKEKGIRDREEGGVAKRRSGGKGSEVIPHRAAIPAPCAR